jgi:hypothetical protein
MLGSRSSGSRSIAFMKKIQTNTVSASGAMKLRSPCTIDLDCDSTISTRISTAAWKRPGTPEVALAAALARIRTASRPRVMDQNRVSRWNTDQSTSACLCPAVQVGQVVNDVFRCVWTVLGCHGQSGLNQYHKQIRFQRQNKPASSASQLQFPIRPRHYREQRQRCRDLDQFTCKKPRHRCPAAWPPPIDSARTSGSV